MGHPHLFIDKISKSFGALKANDDVSITIDRGTIHAILGENGAGKSTLMNMLYGLLQPDSGRIMLDGTEVSIDSPRTALNYGIGMVHQHFMLVGPLTVTENIILGMGPASSRLNLAEHEERVRQLSEEFGFDIDPTQQVATLPIGMQQRVEILKALYRDAQLIILDEPTSVLTPVETASFFKMLRQLRASGKTVVVITHKLEEVMDLSDRVTVMRLGRVTDELETHATNATELARLMVGRDVVLDIDRGSPQAGEILLDVKGLSCTGDRGNVALEDVTFHVRRGEILGFAGVDGNGQAELAEALAGLRKYTSGSVQIDGVELAGRTVANINHDLGISYVPEDRHRTGLILDYTVAENLILRSSDREPFARGGIFLDTASIRQNAEDLKRRYRVKADSIDQPVRRLSGGNQQKVILAREIEAKPRLLVVAQPCKGLDVGAIEFVQETLLKQRDSGVGIIYISTELEHILAVCDRIAVLFRGRIVGIITPEQVTPERIGRMMAGAGEMAA